jgi:hypothetical protein
MARKARRTRSPSRQPVVLDGPTKERLSRGDTILVPTDRTGQFVRLAQSPIQRYAARSEISERQASAAERLYLSYTSGICGVAHVDSYELSGIRTPHRPDRWTPSEHRLAAIERFQAACHALGPSLASLVLAVVCDEQTIDAIATARANGTSARTLRDHYKQHLCAGLTVLADHYGFAPDDNFVPHQLLTTAARLAAEQRAAH